MSVGTLKEDFDKSKIDHSTTRLTFGKRENHARWLM